MYILNCYEVIILNICNTNGIIMKTKLYTWFILLLGSSAISALIFFSNYYSMVNNDKSSLDDGLSLKNMNELNLLRYRDPATGKIPYHIRQKEINFVSQLPGALQNLKSDYDYLLSANWTRRGPINVGGRTRALAVDVRNENIILAGGVSGGMWRSTDGGVSWVKVTAPDQMHSVSCIIQDTRAGKQDTWYYGTGEFYGNSANISGNGIFKSTDNGLSWFPLLSTVSKPSVWESQYDYIWNIVLDYTRNNDDIIHVSTALGGIYRTTNGGTSWESVLGGFGNAYSYYTDLAMTSHAVYYATLSQRTVGDNNDSRVKGIYRSTDGMDWTDITPTNFPGIYSRIVIGIAPSDENQVYFLAAVTTGSGKATLNQVGDTLWNSLFKYTYISGNGAGGGGTWEDRSQNLPMPSTRRGHFNPQGSYNLVVKVKPDNPDVVFIGGTNLYRSNDAFATSNNTFWIGGYNSTFTGTGYQVYPNQHPDQHAIVFMPSNSNIMLSGSDGGVAKTMNNMSDNVEWISLNNGYYTTQFYTVAIDHTSSGDNKIIGGLQDNETLFTNTDNANVDWKSLTQGDGLNCTIADGGSFIITSQNSFYQPKIKIWKLKYDTEGNVTVKTRIDPIGAKDFIWFSPFQLDPHNNNLLYLGGGKLIWRNNDLSSIPEVDTRDSTSIGWDSLPQTRLLDSVAVMTALQVSTNPANIVYYGTSNGKVFKLTDANTGFPTPIEITGSNFPRNAYVSSFAVDEDDANKVIVSFSNYSVQSIFYTTNGGQNWVPISGNLEEFPGGGGSGPAVNWIEILKVNGTNMYYAGTSTGIYSTAYLDGEFTVWQQEGATTIGNVVVDMLDARHSDALLAAATHGAGVFTSTVTGLPSVPSQPALVLPSDNSKGIKDAQVLKWNRVDGASFYKIQIASDSTFSDIFYHRDGINMDSINVEDLEQGKKTYYWHISAKGAGGPSQWSDTWTFTTAIQAPNLLYPETQSDSLPNDVTLQWENVEGATSYHLILAENFLFSKIVLDTIGIIGNSYELKNLKYGQRYYWKMSSIDENGEGIFNRSWNFTTAEYVGVDNESYLSWLGQNYPNPFNTITSISFEIKKRSDVRLEIFDYLGSKVKTIINARMDAGKYTYNIDAAGMFTGKYYYRLKTGNKVETKSMLVNK